MPIIKQLIRSVTSIGANDQEADGALTRKDFVKYYVTVRKETKETNYWLSTRMKDLQQEGKEIAKIVSSIIISAKSKIQIFLIDL